MRNLKKLASLLLAIAVMATTLFGCGKPADSKTTAAPDDKTTEAPVAGPTDGATEEATTAEPEFTYPMDTDAELTFFIRHQSAVKAWGTINDTVIMSELEKATGIKVTGIHETGSNYKEWFNGILADGKAPADVMTWTFDDYAGGPAQAAADGIILMLDDVIEQYMPNLRAYLDSRPEIDKLIKAEDGHYYKVPAIMESSEQVYTYGAFYRKDVLDQLGVKELPTTIDGWHDLLVRVKNETDMIPISCLRTFLFGSGSFANAFVPATYNSEYSIDPATGKIEYTKATDEMKEFIKVMKQWYDEGLIDPDIMTLDSATVKAKFVSGQSFLSMGFAGSSMQTFLQAGLAENPKMEVAAIPGVAKAEGAEIVHSSGNAAYLGGGATISATCPDVEAAARWLDYRFTEEGIVLTNFGVEGESYTYKDGHYHYTDLMLKNPDGKTATQMLGKYTFCSEAFAGVQTLDYLKSYYSAYPAVAEASAIWSSKGSDDYVLYTYDIKHTAEEQDELNMYQSDLKTHADETLYNFVIGKGDIDKDWDNYLKTLESFGLSTVLKIKQDAYDRMK